jgi:hypothetical protein|tara:strand:+ start:1176 stop:1427 length:252 start_codon:yes stop_codon:yes gene_type:complete
MATRTDLFINNIVTVLGKEELTSREVHSKLIDLKVNGRTRRRIPTYRQIVVLLQGNPKFIKVKEEKLPRGRKLRVWRNRDVMD